MAKQKDFVSVFKEMLSQNLVDQRPYPVMPAVQPARQQKMDFAQYLLTHNNKGPKSVSYSPTHAEGAKTEGPSFITRIFDLFSAPLYAVTNTVDDISRGKIDNPMDLAESVGEHVTGSAARMISAGNLGGVGLAKYLPGMPDDLPQQMMQAADKLSPRTTGADLLEDRGVENKVGKYGGGFLLDVALDPLTYVPVIGLGSLGMKASRAAKEAQNAPKRLDEIAAGKAAFTKPDARVSGVTSRENLSYPKSQIDFSKQVTTPVAGSIRDLPPAQRAREFRLPEIPVTDRLSTSSIPPGFVPKPQLDLPGLQGGINPASRQGADEIAYNILNDPESLAHMRDPMPNMRAKMDADFADRMRDARLAKKGKIYDGKGNVSVRSVTEFIDDIQQGKILRFGPEPAIATGRLRDIAVDSADSFITNKLMPKSGAKRIDFNPANQAQLYNKLYNDAVEEMTASLKARGVKDIDKVLTTPRARAQLREQTRQMLRSAEDHMISLQKHPVYWNGTRVRLSDILEEIGPVANDELATKVIKAFVERNMEKITVPEVANAINAALARRSLSVADVLENATSYAKRAKDTIFNTYPYRKSVSAFSKLPDEFATVGRNLGLTDDEVNALKDIVRNVIDVDAIPTEQFVRKLGKEMIQAVKDGRITKRQFEDFNKAIYKTVGETRENLLNDVTGVKVIDTFMTRMTTWFGRGDLKKFSQDVFTYGEMNAYLRGELFRNMVKGRSNEVIENAFKAAADPAALAAKLDDPEVLTVAHQIREYFESVLSSSGMRNTVDQAYTPAVMSRMVMDDVNKHLAAQGSTFQFISGKAKHKTLGIERDYSEKGLGWMASWEMADPHKLGQNPAHLMFDIDLAIEKTMKEYALIDEFIMRFGKHKLLSDYNPKIHNTPFVHNRVPEGVFFEPTVAKEMRRLLTDLSDMYLPRSQVMRFYARGLRAWKTGVTIYLPSHHIRNMIGDLHLMWWAGHNDPRNFIRARRVLHTQRRYLDGALKQDNFAMLNDYTAADALEWAKTKGTDVILRQNGIQLTADELYIAAHQHGLLMNANKLEDIFGEAPLEFGSIKNEQLRKAIANPLGGKAHHVAAMTAEYREHYVRMSHFIGAVNKRMKKSKDLKWILDDAAHEVRKWHPDGRDLTKFEQKVRMAIPFYSWTRKALPLVVQSLAQRPAKVLYYPKANYAMQGMLGIPQEEGEAWADPFPDNQLFPEWIRAKGIGPIGDPQSENPVARWFGHLGRNIFGLQGEEKGYTMVDPSNPFADVFESLVGFGNDPLDVGRSIFDASTPAIKAPGELFISKEKFSGAPISKTEGGEGILAYLAEQVPIISPAQNILEIGKDQRPGKESTRDWQAFVNYLTAAGIRGTGPYVKSAEFEARERARIERKKRRKEVE